jgi:hypothetical protein
VALKTFSGEALGGVIGRFRFLEVGEVATYTFGGQTLAVERAHSSDLVAGIAVDHGVRANERKSILVLVDHVDRYLPSRIAVAKIALRAIFAAMNVRVAVLALLSYAGENKIRVAVLALRLGVHAPQRETRCLGVIKLRYRADRRPAFCGVTILAGNLQRTMGAVCDAVGLTVERRCAQKC